ncbi:MAG: LemA family protein [Chlamydiia bacterium]|nr:LemA family protein [Chlamydiia bacterium]
MEYGLIILVFAALLALFAIGIYNNLIRLKNQVQNAWSQIDVQLQRRYDLIPNLIETVKGYMDFEKGTLEAVVQARSDAVSAKEKVEKSGGPTEGSLKELLAAESTLKGALGNIFALAENYPDLKASNNMKVLQEELSSTENKVAFARQAYNDQAMHYNTYQQEFPNVLFAGLFGHHPAELWIVKDEGVKEAPKVKF